jgi:hypothetical protein
VKNISRGSGYTPRYALIAIQGSPEDAIYELYVGTAKINTSSSVSNPSVALTNVCQNEYVKRLGQAKQQVHALITTRSIFTASVKMSQYSF